MARPFFSSSNTWDWCAYSPLSSDRSLIAIVGIAQVYDTETPLPQHPNEECVGALDGSMVDSNRLVDVALGHTPRLILKHGICHNIIKIHYEDTVAYILSY